MNTPRHALTLLLLLFAAMVGGQAFAAGGHGGGHSGGHSGGYHGGGHHGGGGHWSGSVGFYFGGPAYWPGYWPGYYYPYYPAYYPAYSPPYYAAGPTEYVEQGNSAQAAPPASQSQYWYYCGDSKSYYPYVKECPGGWQRVPAQPPQQQ